MMARVQTFDRRWFSSIGRRRLHRCSSDIATEAFGFRRRIVDWRFAGLNVPSTIRIHKLTVMAKSEIIRSLGKLSGEDQAAIGALLCKVFCLQSKEA